MAIAGIVYIDFWYRCILLSVLSLKRTVFAFTDLFFNLKISFKIPLSLTELSLYSESSLEGPKDGHTLHYLDSG